MYVIGVDIGGTKTEAALYQLSQSFVTELGAAQIGRQPKLICRERRSTERLVGYEHILHLIGDLCLELVQRAQLQWSQIFSVGLGLPGSVDPQTHCMLQGNTMVLENRPFLKDLKNKLKQDHLHFAVDNDANCFTLAEVYCGAGLEFAKSHQTAPCQQTAVGVILGTGTGGGIVVSGRLLRGRHGGGGEIGHICLHPQGHSCYCGQVGCAEQYLSGPAFEAAFQARKYPQIKSAHTAQEIFTLAHSQEPLALAVVQQYRRDLAAFVALLTNVLDPDYFVFGGGMSQQDLIYQGLAQKSHELCFLHSITPQIYKHFIGDSAGVLGAALLPIGPFASTSSQVAGNA